MTALVRQRRAAVQRARRREPAALGRAAGPRRQPDGSLEARRPRRLESRARRRRQAADPRSRSTSASGCASSSTQLSKQTEALQIETEIREKVQNEMGRTQREYMLRQQLEAIRRELGESEDDEERGRAAARGDRGGGHDRGGRSSRRCASSSGFEQTPSAAAEHSVIRTYLDWMTAMPWVGVSRGPPRRRDGAPRSSTRTTSASRRSRTASSSTSRCSR